MAVASVPDTPVAPGTYRSITEALRLPRLIRLGPNLYGAVFTLMKLLPAMYILEQARMRGDIGPDTTIVETTSGTFGLALAMQTALMGCKLILVSDPVIDAHLQRRLTELGAQVEVCTEPSPVGGFQRARLERLAEIQAALPDSFCPDQYNNPDNPRSYRAVAHALFQGPTSGAAYLVAAWWAARNPRSQCVVMLPDEGYRYQATVYSEAWLTDNDCLTAPSDLPAEPVLVHTPDQVDHCWSRLVWDRRAYAEVPGVVPRVSGPATAQAVP